METYYLLLATVLFSCCSLAATTSIVPFHALEPKDYYERVRPNLNANVDYVRNGQEPLRIFIRDMMNRYKTDMDAYIIMSEAEVNVAIDDNTANLNMHIDAASAAPISKPEVLKCLPNEPSAACSAMFLDQIQEFRKCKSSRTSDYQAINDDINSRYAKLVDEINKTNEKFNSCDRSSIQSMTCLSDAYMESIVLRHRAQYYDRALREEAELRFAILNNEIEKCICDATDKLSTHLAETVYNIKKCILDIVQS